MGNVLLGRPHDFKAENDLDGSQCFVAGEGTQGVTRNTCAETGRFEKTRLTYNCAHLLDPTIRKTRTNCSRMVRKIEP